MGENKVKMKIEIGKYKFECEGSVKDMTKLALANIQSFEKTLNPY